MREAVIVSTARTPIGKAYRGAFNQTHGAELGGHSLRHAIARSKVDPAEIEDVIIGCGMPQGATGYNIGRQIAICGGLPIETGGTTVNRLCASGLQAIAIAAQRIMVDRVPVMAAGGLECISIVQDEHHNGVKKAPGSRPTNRTPTTPCCARPKWWRNATASAATRRTITPSRARCARPRRSATASSTTRSSR